MSRLSQFQTYSIPLSYTSPNCCTKFFLEKFANYFGGHCLLNIVKRTNFKMDQRVRGIIIDSVPITPSTNLRLTVRQVLRSTNLRMTVRQVADAGQQLKGQHARLTEIKTIILQNLNILAISPLIYSRRKFRSFTKRLN